MPQRRIQLPRPVTEWQRLTRPSASRVAASRRPHRRVRNRAKGGAEYPGSFRDCAIPSRTLAAPRRVPGPPRSLPPCATEVLLRFRGLPCPAETHLRYETRTTSHTVLNTRFTADVTASQRDSS